MHRSKLKSVNHWKDFSNRWNALFLCHGYVHFFCVGTYDRRISGFDDSVKLYCYSKQVKKIAIKSVKSWKKCKHIHMWTQCKFINHCTVVPTIKNMMVKGFYLFYIIFFVRVLQREREGNLTQALVGRMHLCLYMLITYTQGDSLTRAFFSILNWKPLKSLLFIKRSMRLDSALAMKKEEENK